MTTSPETPQVFQSKQREGFIRGRRSSVASAAELFEETLDDSPRFSVRERTFTIRFEKYDEIQTVLHLDGYSNREIRRTWYRSKDYEKMMMGALEAVRKASKKKKSKNNDATDQRGLEAWTAKGAERSKLLKDNAVQAVWNEQSFQWDKGIFDPDRIRDCYIPYSTGAQDAARKRAIVDATVYEKEVKKLEKEESKKRNLLSRGKAAFGKSIKFTTKNVAKTSRIVGDATVQSGQVAKTAGKRTARAGIGVATLDQRMVKEAFAQKSKEKVGSQRFRRPSQMSKLLDSDEGGHKGGKSSQESNFKEQAEVETQEDKNPEKLKLFGVVPLPGTKKMYNEDLEKEKVEKRRNVSQLPSWESSKRESGKI